MKKKYLAQNTYLSRFLLHFFSSTPRHVVQITQRVYNKQHIHTRYSYIVYNQIQKTVYFLRMQSGRNKEYSKCNHCKYTRWGQPSIFYNLKYNTYYHDHHQHSVQAGYNHGDKQLKQYKKKMSQSTIYIHLSSRYESSSFYLVFKKSSLLCKVLYFS